MKFKRPSTALIVRYCCLGLLLLLAVKGSPLHLLTFALGVVWADSDGGE